MKWFIAILIIVGLAYGGYQLVEYQQSFEQKKPANANTPVNVDIGDQLAGLPPDLGASLSDARGMGPKALGKWIQHNKKKVQDPRLGWIQLDYVVLIAPSDLYEARRVFKEVRDRTDPSSPVIPRLKQLEKTYQ